MDYAEEILALSEELDVKSTDFKNACTKYAEHYYEFQRLLGVKIMRMENKKPSMEKIICEALAEEVNGQKEFCLHYKGYEYYKALKTGLEAQIEAIRTKIMARQSVMRFNGKLDTYGKV